MISHLNKGTVFLRCAISIAGVMANAAMADDNPLNLDEVIGLTVNIENSTECGGSNSSSQRVPAHAPISGGSAGCPVNLAITVTGSVETEDAPYDFVYVNDVLFFSGEDWNGDCAMTTKTVTKTVTVDPKDGITLTYDTSDGLFHTGAYATITHAEIVEEGCASGCEAGGAALENGSVHLALNLGRADFGNSIGALRIAEAVPSPVLGTPSSLRYSSAWDGVEVIRDLNDAIRQVKAPDCLADVVTETEDRFRVDFYRPNEIGAFTSGLYDQAGKTPYVSWIIENIDTVNNGHTSITEVKGASSNVNEFIWDAVGNGWELVTGNGQRKEKKTTVVDALLQTRTVTAVVKNAADQVVSKSVKTYKDFAWGRELIQTVVDPDGAALTSTQQYFDNITLDGGGYRRLKAEFHDDGGWAKHSYDSQGRLTKTIKPFLDAEPTAAENLCEVTTITYQNVAPQETHIVTILGQEVQRTYKLNSGDYTHTTAEIVATVAGALYTAPSNLVTTRVSVGEGEFTGDLLRVELPDGTGETYEYSKTATEKTTIRNEGEMINGFVVSGTRTTTVSDLAGNLLAESTEDIQSGLLLSLKTVTVQDASGKPSIIDYDDGTVETFNYGCCGIESFTDRDGIATSYTYDVFKRLLSETRAGITTSFVYDAEGRILSRKRTGSDSSEIVQEINVYDVAGRLVSTADALNYATGRTYTVDGDSRKVETVTYPDGGTAITVKHKDGRTYDISGTAVAPHRIFYGVDAGEGYYERQVNVSSTGGLDEWTKSWQDIAGRVVKIQKNGRTAATRYYNATGKLEKTVDPDGVVTLYTSNPTGSLSSSILDVNRDGLPSATDRIEITSSQVLEAHGTVVLRTEQRIINAAGVEELVSQTDISTHGRSRWASYWGQNSTAVISYGAGASRTEIFTQPDGSTETRIYTQDRLVSETIAASGGNPILKSISYSYDPHGRLQSATDARNGTTSVSYDAMDRILAVTSPVPALASSAQTTARTYDSMGRVTTTTLADNSEVIAEYFLTGALKKQSGSQVPTTEYTYDSQGRKKTMLTTGQAGPATTHWNYEITTGWLSGKSYPGGDSISYSSTDAGRLLTRNTGRGITRTYVYDQGGRSTGVNYSDTTPDVTYTLNRLGQITGVIDAIGTRIRTYATDGRLLTESHTAGLLTGAALELEYDTLLRRENFSASSNGSSFETTWAYDGASRLSVVTSGVDSTTYTYAANSGLVTGASTARGGVPRLAVTSEYDALERLTSISSSSGASVISSHAYNYNLLNQRTESLLENGSKWHYQYDTMGQVTDGQKRNESGWSVPGMKFGYSFDGIGNRSSSTINGRAGSYAANVANQYTERQVPGAVDIRGKANLLTKVTVNTELTDRLHEYFYKELEVDNSGAPQYVGVSVVAVKNDAGPNGEDIQSEKFGNLFLAKNPEVFTHDEEGNLTSDGRWNYTWDGENRLIGQETIVTVPTAAKQKLEYSYDAESRRIQKKVFGWDGSVWLLENDHRYLYDGWNLVAEMDATNIMLRNFVWGLDLSRTPQGAGGVGGLVAIREGAESHLPCYDGNGNAMALVKASDQSISARYEYGPFGESLVAEEIGVSNPFRFSTKFQDKETGLYYYGFRYYSPETGRWLSRDPIEEQGGHNLYSFVSNDPVVKFDLLGMVELTFAYITRIEPARVTFMGSTFNGGIKTTQTVSVDPDQCTITFSSKSIGTTIKYASPTGPAVATARASGSTIKQSVSRPIVGSRRIGRRDPCKCVLKMSGNEGNPLAPGAPGITYHVTITFDTKAKKYDWEVKHDNFPSHKLTGNTGKVLLDFSHVAAGTIPWGLFRESESDSGNESW
jgi:RHS repeat-associated protein